MPKVEFGPVLVWGLLTGKPSGEMVRHQRSSQHAHNVTILRAALSSKWPRLCGQGHCLIVGDQPHDCVKSSKKKTQVQNQHTLSSRKRNTVWAPLFFQEIYWKGVHAWHVMTQSLPKTVINHPQKKKETGMNVSFTGKCVITLAWRLGNLHVSPEQIKFWTFLI